MASERYQIALIVLGLVATAFLGAFFYRELFPEYRVYQDDYIALEKFRSTYSGEPPPEFKVGIKQIVFEREDKGPPLIDRCVSCHVALQLPHFSPTKIQHDADGNSVRDANGTPVKVVNEEYIWAKLDQKIAELTDDKVNQHLKEQGEMSKVDARLKQAEELKSLKTAQVGDHVYDVTKVLAMHPLMGKETRPFEFHSLDEYGCTSCHGGNGKGLTSDKAHGPVFDEEYETEYMGPKSEFLEKDPNNDPSFARVFNDKPGDALLFQTTPILVGSLMQAKCIQCHENMFSKAAIDEHTVLSKESDVDRLTKDYHRGQQLYISQACYACHRIAGMARGGVGPDLTRAAGMYPWYMKEKIVWPQGTLKTSTMPNMHLDHAEVEDLMTFLLAQKGPGKAVSEIDYKVAVQQWENGRKMSWEKSIPPSKLHDLSYSMTIFATQGCAACHRLEGFESNVGYRIEKENNKPSFEALYKEHEWFQKLFPESIVGSDIVKVIDARADEIDKHIVDNVRQGSLLEELEEKYPDSIESLYSDFRYASRAKNHEYSEMANAASNPEQKNAALAKLDEWKKRIHRILMMYVQEYGLGRIIGPRPNWSGVYRSDEWLMEHFHNPAGHVPKSIMPIFPFDDTKFYALTYMLDVLGKRNRDHLRAIWEHRGFDPSQAFHIHCAQCHGDYLQGNGPVSQWIYPVPKSLRNAEFLRNLTKENAMMSITHGVKGTPMPPWGETPTDKFQHDGIPVLNKDEIGMLVDWLFSSLPGGRVIQKSQDVPKWQYQPQDVIEELKREGGQLTSEPQQTVFDVVPNPLLGGDKNAYYIKQKYYTADNVEEGRKFFENNCAVCHGKDADGAGVRASIMLDAKPRMLINLDWANMRDDLRLLRSIKYGIPGTAMTPWGDLTSSLQRLQLVMFIRSLSRENEFRDQLTSGIYKGFDRSLDQIEMARITEYTLIDQLKNQINDIQKQQQAAFEEAQNHSDAAAKALDFYKQQIDLTSKLKKHETLDQMLIDLKKMIKKEADIYKEIGMDLNRSGIDGSDWKGFLQMLAFNDSRFAFKEDQLTFNVDPKRESQISELGDQIVRDIDAKIEQLQKQKIVIQGKIYSEERNIELKDIEAQINTLTKSKSRLLSGLDEIKTLNKEEETIFKQYHNQHSSK